MTEGVEVSAEAAGSVAGSDVRARKTRRLLGCAVAAAIGGWVWGPTAAAFAAAGSDLPTARLCTLIGVAGMAATWLALPLWLSVRNPSSTRHPKRLLLAFVVSVTVFIICRLAVEGFARGPGSVARFTWVDGREVGLPMGWLALVPLYTGLSTLVHNRLTRRDSK